MPFSFEKLEVYQRSLELADRMYEASKSFPREERFGITSQLRAAALSIAQNIAEGSGRHSKKDFGHFLQMARASAYECIPLLDIACRQGFVSKDQRRSFYAELDEIARMINGLINSLRDQP